MAILVREFIGHMCTCCLSYGLFYMLGLMHCDGTLKHATLGNTYLHNPKPENLRGTQKQVVLPECLDLMVTAWMNWSHAVLLSASQDVE